MTSTHSPNARHLISALVSGLIAMLMTLVFVAPANASIIYDPNDDRYQLTATTPPYSSVVEILLPGNLGRCSGWMYAPNMVATAGHCVYDKTAVTTAGSTPARWWSGPLVTARPRPTASAV